MAIEDIKRHQHSINQCAARKYPDASFQVAVYILDYIKSPVFPDVQIEMIPMEGPEWVPSTPLTISRRGSERGRS